MRQDILHGVTTAEDIGTINRYLCADVFDALADLRAKVLELTRAPDCVLTCNCTQALRVALSLFVPRGTVVVPDMTFVATAHAALAAGHEVRLVDVDAETLHMSLPGAVGWPDSASAVAPVELLGRPISDGLVEELSNYGAPIIVDAAQSLGATRWRHEYKAMVVSFAANKIVHGHQGGAILCRKGDADAVRRYIRHGRANGVTTYHHESAGENLGMNPLGAALAVSQCGRIERIMERRCDQRHVYFMARAIDDGDAGNYWLHVGQRSRNIDKPHCDLWEPLHMQPHLQADPALFPNASAAFADLVALPSSDDLTPEQIEETYK